MGPRSCYEEGKRFGEALCKAYRDEYGLDVRIGRIFNSYRPRLRAEGFYGRVVSRFLLQALRGEELTVYGDGSQTRSFCYATDTVAGLLLMMRKDGLQGEALNLGSQEETKIVDLAWKIINISKSESKVGFRPFPAGDHTIRLPSTEKARKAMGWGPKVGLGTGLERTYQWLKARERIRSSRKNHVLNRSLLEKMLILSHPIDYAFDPFAWCNFWLPSEQLLSLADV